MSGMDKITPAQLDESLVDGSEPFVLDIRPRASFSAGHIDGSHSIPVYSDLQRGDETAFRSRLDELPSDRRIVVMCKAGIVARRATSILREEGYDAATALGGMSGWTGYQRSTLGYRLRALLWRLTGAT